MTASNLRSVALGVAGLLCAAAIGVALADDPPAADSFGAASVASVTPQGAVGDEVSALVSPPRLSGDGQLVAFDSYADDLVPGDTNGHSDVFVRDRATHTTTRVSLDVHGDQIDGDSSAPAISADGTTVAWVADLGRHASDGTPWLDIVVRTLATGAEQVVTSSAKGSSGAPSLDATGAHVAFATAAPNLVSGDTNTADDVIVDTLSTGAIVRASSTAGGVAGDGGSDAPVLSGDGGTVAYATVADNLVSGDTNNRSDVVATVLATGATTLMSARPDGAPGDGDSLEPSISADGSQVAFATDADDLVTGDTDDLRDVVVASLTDHTVRAVSALDTTPNGPSDAPSISGDGALVLFTTAATNLVGDDTDVGLDVLARRGTAPLALVSAGSGGASYGSDVDGNGDVVAFASEAVGAVTAVVIRPDTSAPAPVSQPSASASSSVSAPSGPSPSTSTSIRPSASPSPATTSAGVAGLTLQASSTFVRYGQSETYSGVVSVGGHPAPTGTPVVLTSRNIDRAAQSTIGITTTRADGSFVFTNRPLYITTITASALGASASVPVRVVVTFRSFTATVTGGELTVHATTRPGFFIGAGRQERAQLILVDTRGHRIKVLATAAAHQRHSLPGEAHGVNDVLFTVRVGSGTYRLVVKIIGTPVNTGASTVVLTTTAR